MERTRIDVGGATHAGRVRPANEDQYLIASLGKSLEIRSTSLDVADSGRLARSSLGYLLTVADGMGGHVAGREASRIAVDSTVRYVLECTPSLFRLQPGGEEDPGLEELAKAVAEGHRALQRDVQEHPERSGMGTTLTMAYVLWPRLYVVHVGDSRCYVLRRDGGLQCLTVDHTVAQRLVEEGSMSVEQARASPYGHVLWNVVGGPEEGGPAAEVHAVPLQPGDTLVLCTDGLTRHVDDDAIARTVRGSSGAEDACQTLVAAALEGGGEDNVTVVVARFDPAAPGAEPLAPVCDSE